MFICIQGEFAKISYLIVFQQRLAISAEWSIIELSTANREFRI